MCDISSYNLITLKTGYKSIKHQVRTIMILIYHVIIKLIVKLMLIKKIDLN